MASNQPRDGTGCGSRAGELLPRGPLTFAATRAEALRQLRDFVPRVGRYSRDRNKLLPGHPNVSRLSPAVRHRLITEEECCAAPLRRYAPSTVEKFIQEVYWRRYWKAWLSLRPQVWADYQAELRELRQDSRFAAVRRRAAGCEAGKGPIDLMNYFASELIETGYLHNHARMWFAGWWIHVERLPWQLGADFFFRHLLDADPASNTLSWRWVAGLQTPGKTYLPRRSNIEKHVHPEILDCHRDGLELLERPEALRPESITRDPITRASLPEEPEPGAGAVGVWVHEEDFLPEQGPLAALNPQAVVVAGSVTARSRPGFPSNRKAWLDKALADAHLRASRHFGGLPELECEQSLLETLPSWAARHQLRQVVALSPEVGPLADLIPRLRQSLAKADVQLVLLHRPEDLALRSFATGGFFAFWKRCRQLPPSIPST